MTDNEFGERPPRCSEAEALVWLEKLRGKALFSLESGRSQESLDSLSVPVWKSL